MFGNIYNGKRVLVTGNTGFKGSWLCNWLVHLGAEVAGFALEPPTDPSLFETSELSNRMCNFTGDIRNRDSLLKVFREFRPEIVFHLAAQSLVRRSYRNPAETFETNVLGTLNVLECLRVINEVSAAVIITSDKCYRNVEWVWGYRENDMLGGEDPYSGSKGAAEIVTYSYMHSFFKDTNSTALATARAGNVIGGGDWAEDRIVPDCVRSWSQGKAVILRNPEATRPWQHVLEPLSGYLWLGSQLYQRKINVINQSYNFGPDATVNQPVIELIRQFSTFWPRATWKLEVNDSENRPEARLLKLSCDKSLADLNWHAVLPFKETVRFTSQWYRSYYENGSSGIADFTLAQISEYCEKAKHCGLIWSET